MAEVINNPNGNSVIIPEKLTLKQKLWIQHYLGDCKMNATEAAARAGYGGNRQTLQAIGSENLRNPTIRNAIEEWARRHVTPRDVVERLCDIAMTSMEDFVSFSGKDARKQGVVHIDLIKAQRNGRLRCVKRLRVRKTADGGEEIDVELYDSMLALQLLGKHFGLFDKQQTSKAQLEYLLGALPDELREGIYQSLGLLDGTGRGTPALGEGNGYVEADPGEVEVSDSVLE